MQLREEVCRGLWDEALGGNVAAIRLLLAYLIGPPPRPAQPEDPADAGVWVQPHLPDVPEQESIDREMMAGGWPLVGSHVAAGGFSPPGHSAPGASSGFRPTAPSAAAPMEVKTPQPVGKDEKGEE